MKASFSVGLPASAAAPAPFSASAWEIPSLVTLASLKTANPASVIPVPSKDNPTMPSFTNRATAVSSIPGPLR